MQIHDPAHPGEVLREYMGDAEVTAFAEKVGVNRVSMSRLLNGQSGISAQMALSIAKVLRTTPELWMNLQVQYDLWQARVVNREAKRRSGEVKMAGRALIALVEKKRAPKARRLVTAARPATKKAFGGDRTTIR